MLSKLFPAAIKQSMIYGLSIALMKSVSLIMLPITAFYLQPQQFGQLELLTSIGIVCSILVGLGLENTLFRYAGVNSDTDQDPDSTANSAANSKRNSDCIGNKKSAATILIMALIAGSIALGIGWFVAPIIIANIAVDISVGQLQTIFVVISLEGAVAIPLAWFRMQERVLTFFLATSLRTITQAVLIVIFLQLQYGVNGVLAACLIAATIQAFILSTMMLKEVGLVGNLKHCVRYLKYSLPIVGSGFIAFSLAGFDRWLLAAQSSLTDVAIYGIAAKFALATVLLVQPFGMWWLPKRFVVLKQNLGIAKAAHYIMIGIIVVMAIAVVVSFVAPFLIHWLLAPQYHGAIDYVLWLVLAMAFKEISELVNIGCFYDKSTYQQLVVNLVCAFIGLSIMWVGITHWGIWAVVIALNVAYFTKAVLFYMVSQHNLPLPYDGLKLAIVISLAISLIGLSQYVPMSWSGWLMSMLVLLVALITIIKRDLLSLIKTFPSANG